MDRPHTPPDKQPARRTIRRRLYAGIIVAELLFIGYIVLRTCFFTWVSVPSSSMEPALQPGDRVLIRKSEGEKISSLIRRNDVLLFHFPCKKDWKHIEKQPGQFYIKRCIGLPGDDVSIRNGFYRISGQQAPAGYLPQQRLLSSMADELLSPEIKRTFPYDSLMPWDIRNFGPLHLPVTGDTLQATEANYRLYGRYIAYETHREITYRDSAFYIGNDTVSRYVFRKNYYFMAGDQVSNSQDSRYWGLLPEECIAGKAVLILCSVSSYTGQIGTSRFFKPIAPEP